MAIANGAGLRENDSGRRRPLWDWLLLAVILLGLCGLAVAIVAMAVAQPATETPRRPRVTPEMARFNAWERQLKEARDEGEFEAVEAAARRTLAEAPLAANALRLLALAAETRGHLEAAERLMERAEERNRADVAVQAWLLKRRLETGRVEEAMEPLDAMLRADPNLLRTLLPVIVELARVPDGARALADLLAREPPWRAMVLREVALRAPDLGAPASLFKAVGTGPRPPSAAELNPYLDRLVAARLYLRAFMEWTKSLPRQRISELSSLNNGSFERVPTGAPFDWKLDPVRGARMEIVSGGVSGGKALRIEFLNARVPFQHVRQLVLLVPGYYELQGKVRVDRLQTAGSLRWKISCADEPEGASAVGERLAETQGWDDFVLPFNIPARGCKAQWLTLELAARIPSERQIVGRVWFDGLKIELVPPTERPRN